MTHTEFKQARRPGPPLKPLSEFRCCDCGASYSPDTFYHQKSRRSGLRPSARCKKCTNANTSSGNRDRSAYRRTPRGLAADLIVQPRRRGRTCTITVDWICERIERGHCEVTGIPFDLSRVPSGRNPFTPSLDQKIPGGGYTPENTQVVVWIYNAAKGTWSHADVMKLVEALNDTHRI